MESSNSMVIENEFCAEEQVFLVSDDGSIIIDENTTFVDDDGNPVIVNRSAEGENIEFIFQGENDATDTTEKILSSDSQEHTSSEQEGIPTTPNDLLEGEKKSEEENIEHEAQFEFNKITSSSTATTISFLKRKKRALSDETAAVCNSVTVIENKEVKKVKPIKVKKDIPEGTVIDDLTCKYCLKKFANEEKKFKHYRIVHKVTKTSLSDYIKCVECNISFYQVPQLTDHLRLKHNLKMDVQELSFSNMNEFYKWKAAIEREELTKYCQAKSHANSRYKYKYFNCHRSGKKRPSRLKGPTRARMPKREENSKMGLMCTSNIRIKEYPNIVEVWYCPHHYGHGKETTYRKLTPMEHNAIQETVSNGVAYENILDDMHEDSANAVVVIKKRKDFKILRKAFDTEERTPIRLSDADSLNLWVRTCSQMEDSPVLYYRQEEDEISLVIMTEFQKNILLSSDKQILCVDNTHRGKGGRFYLMSLMALDECETAFPVAFCISNKVDKSMVKQFLMSIRDSTGPLSCAYFMSDSESFYYEAWQEVMEGDSKWLWNKWYADNSLFVQLRQTKLSIAARSDLYKRLKLISDCKNMDVFETMFKNFTADLCADPELKNVAKLIVQAFGNSKKNWAYCYHKDLKLGLVMQLEILHRIMRFCCREGRKKRLDKFIFVLMKLVRFKMLHRLTSMNDEEKISLAVEAINAHHNSGFEIPTHCISSLGDKIWMISSENEEENLYVHREYDSCPDFCSLKCFECDICVHMFSCSCTSNMIYADLCPHIHAVVWKFLTPHFSPLPSPARDYCEEVDDNDVEESSAPSQPTELFDTVLKMTHNVFKKVRSSKSTLNESTLYVIKDHLSELMDICSGNIVQNSNNVLNVTNTASQTSDLPNLIKPEMPTNPKLKGANTAPKIFIIPNTAGSTLLSKTNPIWSNTAPKTFIIPNTIGSMLPTKPNHNVTSTIPHTFIFQNPIGSQLCTNPKANETNTDIKTFIIQKPIGSTLPTNREPNVTNLVQKNFVLTNSIGSLLPTKPNPNVTNSVPQTIFIPNQIGSQLPTKPKPNAANTPTKSLIIQNPIGSTLPTNSNPNVTNTAQKTIMLANPIRSTFPTNPHSQYLMVVPSNFNVLKM